MKKRNKTVIPNTTKIHTGYLKICIKFTTTKQKAEKKEVEETSL